MERWSAVTYNIEGVLPLKPDTCHRVEAHDESLVVDRVPNCLRRRLSPPSQLPANNKTLRMALDGGGRLVVLDAQTHEVSPCPSLYRRGGSGMSEKATSFRAPRDNFRRRSRGAFGGNRLSKLDLPRSFDNSTAFKC
eukprot:CAMPEP_0115744810 /NCGR_PEP_ID=MMETSP0272-20121206/91799_1 /TAXON_ID=71861 /ORGANISM="Scrippsiella trochoidea, Strain CCMP3099" /LENGTH=136 /DNA_ID=CAMNT_0003189703 /DNA_START=69 /DNA_END=476 /DNA_ORIENTATION=+